MHIQRLLRLLYSIVAFGGAIMLHDIDRGFTVLAQQQEYRSQQAFEHGGEWDRHDEKDREIDLHLTTTDAKVGELAEKVSLICGVGATIVTGLGVLNLLGFLRPQSGSHEPPGKTHFITPE